MPFGRKNKWSKYAQKEKAKNVIAKNVSIAPAMAAMMQRNRKKNYTSGVYCFKQLLHRATFNSLAGADQTGALAFTLNGLDQAATFVALFDQFRIDKIVATFMPRAVITKAENAGFVGAQPGYLVTAIDYDDAVAPASVAALRQHSNAKFHSTIRGMPIKRTFVPRASLSAYAGTLPATGFALASSKTWFDCSVGGIEYYGLKWAMPGGLNSNQIAFDVECEYYLSFKGIH